MSLFSSVAVKASTPTLDLAFSANNQFLYALNGARSQASRPYHDGSIAKLSTIGGLPASAAGLAAT